MAEEPTESVAEALESSAKGPRQVTVAGMGSSEEHWLTDQIAAAKFLAPTATKKRVGAGIRFTKATAGGSM